MDPENKFQRTLCCLDKAHSFEGRDECTDPSHAHAEGLRCMHVLHTNPNCATPTLNEENELPMYSYYDMSSDWEWIAEARPLSLNCMCIIIDICCANRHTYACCMYASTLRITWRLHAMHHDASDVLVKITQAKQPYTTRCMGRDACYSRCADDDGTAVAPVAPACSPASQATWMREKGWRAHRAMHGAYSSSDCVEQQPFTVSWFCAVPDWSAWQPMSWTWTPGMHSGIRCQTYRQVRSGTYL